MVKNLQKSSIGCINSLWLSTPWCRKDLFRNIKDKIILEVFKSNHLEAYEKQYWRLGGRFTKKIKLERSPKLSVQHKKNILWQTKFLQEEIGNFCVKRVMIKAGIPLSISMETVSRVLWKAGLKWTHVQRKGFKTKPEPQKLWLGENLDKDLILVSLGK